MAELKEYLNERGLREVWDIINGQNSLIVSKIKDIQKRATVGLYADSTSGWAENESKISEAGALYIYTDAETFNGKVIAKVKIGDGTSSLADLSFIDAPYSAHIADRDIHFTAEERAQWNDEISAFATAAQVAEDRTVAENAAQTTQSIADSLPADINTKVETNKQDISFIKLNYVSKQKLNTCLDKNAFKATYSTFIDYRSPNFESEKSMFVGDINSGSFMDKRIGLGSGFELREVIENVPCIIDHKESTKTVEYDIYFRCVAVDFFRPKNWSSKGSFTFMPTAPIGTNIIDNATGLGDIHAYSQTFIQQKVMPVYAAHFKSLFGENLAEFSDPLPLEIRKDVGSYAYNDRGGRSVENYGNKDEYTSYSLRLPSEPEIFGHYITSGCNDNSGMESQLPYFVNNPITAWDWSFFDDDKGMWLSSYSGANYYGYYNPKSRTIGSRPAIVEYGIFPLLTLVRK